MKSRPTIRDVAELAKVSDMTVSRVLAGKAKHGVATTERVLKAAEVLGYRPNGFARQLRNKDQPIVGVIFTRMPDSSATLDLIESKILGALEAELIRNRVPVLLSSVSAEEIEAGTMPDIVSQGYVDTVVCLFLENPAYVAALKSRTRHLIHIGRTDASVAQVDTDNRSGAQMAARHLHALGHRDIVLVRPKEYVIDHIERMEVFVSEFVALAGAEGRIRFAECSVWNDDFTESALEQILNPKLPDAIFCTNDFLALQILRGLKRHGVAVPGDVSLMGFDDMELAAYSDPPLTTIGIDKLAIGKKAAELALGCLRGESAPPAGPSILPVHLIERASTVRRA
ncbi:MAG: LacI family DNA-binding transcriptional regulator [Verrucomicrobia bacterium]|nr:LacI family DNA-binding transcriptional regulator [Verrucomicrobiota bacterium]